MALEWLKPATPGGVSAYLENDRAPHPTLHDRVASLYESTRGELFRFLVILGVAPEAARELCQEAYLKLYIALRAGQSIDNPRAWLFTVARNSGLNARKQQSRISPLDDGEASAIVGHGLDPEQSLLERERLGRLHDAVSSLSPQQRHCLFLRAEGFRYAEIASILGIATSSVGEFLRRAVDRLRRAVYD